MRTIDRTHAVESRSFRPVASRRVFARAGFTLIESLIASVILAFGSLTLATAMLSVQTQTEAIENTYDTGDAARQLMEEIVSLPLVITSGTDKPGWAQGTQDKSTYDNVFDYDGFRDTWPSEITFKDNRFQNAGNGSTQSFSLGDSESMELDDGTTPSTIATPVYRQSQQCTRAVAVRYVNPPSASVLNNGDFAEVTVTVTPVNGRGAPITLKRFVTAITITR